MKKFIALLMAIVGLACSGVLAIADSHNWNEGEWIQLPSCSVQGQRKYTCTNPGCDAQYVEQVGMLEHFFLPATCTDKPICQWCKRPKKAAKNWGILNRKRHALNKSVSALTAIRYIRQLIMRIILDPQRVTVRKFAEIVASSKDRPWGMTLQQLLASLLLLAQDAIKQKAQKKHMCIFLPLAPSLPHAGIAVRRPALTKTITSRMASVPFAISRSTRWTMSRTKKMT